MRYLEVTNPNSLGFLSGLSMKKKSGLATFSKGGGHVLLEVMSIANWRFPATSLVFRTKTLGFLSSRHSSLTERISR